MLDYFDVRTGVRMTHDASARTLARYVKEFPMWKASKAAERRAQETEWAREREARARREERHNAEIAEQWLRDHPDTAAEAQMCAGSTQAFQFSADSKPIDCIRCGGTGALFVPGNVQQNAMGWAPDPLALGCGPWQLGTVRTTRHMDACH